MNYTLSFKTIGILNPDFHHPLRHIHFWIVSPFKLQRFCTTRSVPPEKIRSTGALVAKIIKRY